MKTDFNRLNTFVHRNAEDAVLASRVMTLIHPLFPTAESDEYALAPAEEIDQRAAAAAIATLTGREVKDIFFISLSHPPVVPADPNDNGFVPGTPVVVSRMLRAGLGYGFRKSLRSDAGPNGMWEALGTAVSTGLGGTMRVALWDALEKSLDDDLRRDGCRQTLWDALFCLLGAAILGDDKEVDRFAPIFEDVFLKRAFPFGEKKGGQGTEVLLVA